MSRRPATRRPRRRAAGAAAIALAALALVALSLPGTGTTAPGGLPLALPELGVAGPSTAILDAVSGGEPGEVWAYTRLGADIPQPRVGDRLVQFGSAPGTGTPDPQLAFLRHTDATGWQVYETPVDEGERVLRSLVPNADAARMVDGGGGVMVAQDADAPLAEQAAILRRQPGGRFTRIARPPATVLLPADDPVAGDPAEVIAEDRGRGRVNLTAFATAGRTGFYVVPAGREVENAVIRNSGADGAGAWTREEIDTGPVTSFKVAAIAARTSGDAWLVARDATDGIRLFRRESDTAPQWRELTLGATPFSDAAEAASAGVSEVRPLDGAAQTLTVTSDGVWVDGQLESGGATSSFTLFVKPSGAMSDRVTSWCDVASVCDHGLADARFSTGQGYRSFAWPGAGSGTRIVTNILRTGGDDSTNRGAYLRIDGASARRVPGAGSNFQPSGAFFAVDDGWLGGPVRITQAAPAARLRSWPVALRAPLTDAAPEPGKPPGSLDSGALAVGGDGAVARFEPAQGWVREFLLSSNGNVSRPALRGVAWPEAGRAHAVGDLGAMWLWRSDTGLWERDPGAPIGFEANMMDVAFEPGNPSRGYAVGKEGTILRYDKSWLPEAVPAGFEEANFTSIAFSGSTAYAVTAGAVLVNDGAGWREDAEIGLLLAEIRRGFPFLYAAAGLPDGGAIIAGRNIVLKRERAGAPWTFAGQPTLQVTAVAVSAFREDGRLRAMLAGVPVLQYPSPDPPIEVDPNVPPPILPPFLLPGDGYVLRETATGWRDEQRAVFGGSGNDRPAKADPVAAFLLDERGAGWAVGGWSGAADSAGRGTSGRGGGARQVRARVQTGTILRYEPSGAPPAAPPAESAAPVPLSGTVARFAIGGHAECDQPCAELSNQSIAPDRTLSVALQQAGQMAGREGGPRAFLYTGGRTKPGGGQQRAAEASRYAELLSASPLPAFPAVSAGDSEGGNAVSFRAAFSGFAAPFGGGATPAGMSPVAATPASPGARTHYAFDSTGPAGTVRVVVIDNSAGSLADSDPHQNPAEPQEPWLRSVLSDARARGIPSIVVGSRDLNTGARPALNIASDGDAIAQLLVDEGASAYFFDRPEENRVGAVPGGGAVTIPTFGTGALGYRSPTTNAASIGRPDALFGAAAFLLAEIDVARRDPRTNRAPVAVRAIPVLESLSLQAVDGVLLRRSRPSLFQGLGRRPVAGDRWGPLGGGDAIPSPAGSDAYTTFPPEQCVIQGCSTRIVPEYRFVSSDPDIADFVQQDPQSTNLRKPLLGGDDKVVTDNSSGLLCPFNAGETTVTVSAGGLSYAQRIRVQAGSVQRPCGTRPLDPSRFQRQVANSATPATPPPPPTPASAPVEFSPPPPPVVPAAIVPEPTPRTPRTPGRPLPVIPPLPFLPVVPNGTVGLPPIPVPPPAPFFAQTIPPGGATVRVHEEKREEEEAYESSSAFSAYDASEHEGLSPYWAGLLVLGVIAGVGLRPPRRREARPAVLRADFTDDPRTTHRRRRR
jgi:hypothetical protein